MSVIDAISGKRYWIAGAAVAFMVVFVFELRYLASQTQPFRPSPTQELVGLLPPLGAWICFNAFTYWAWFRKPDPTLFGRAKFVFFWFLTVGAGVFWLNMIVLAIRYAVGV